MGHGSFRDLSGRMVLASFEPFRWRVDAYIFMRMIVHVYLLVGSWMILTILACATTKSAKLWRALMNHKYLLHMLCCRLQDFYIYHRRVKATKNKRAIFLGQKESCFDCGLDLTCKPKWPPQKKALSFFPQLIWCVAGSGTNVTKGGGKVMNGFESGAKKKPHSDQQLAFLPSDEWCKPM